jgi:hypothetical protein
MTPPAPDEEIDGTSQDAPFRRTEGSKVGCESPNGKKYSTTATMIKARLNVHFEKLF